jgi:alpha-glucosidase (family GH31 glycosyl hydrolase)
MAGLLDVTNPAAVLWYLKKLDALRNAYNISSFKFDAGETVVVINVVFYVLRALFAQLVSALGKGLRVAGSKLGLDSDHILSPITVNWFAIVSIM